MSIFKHMVLPASMNRLGRAHASAALFGATSAFAQTVTLDDFTSLRDTFDNATKLWQVANGQCNRQEGGATQRYTNHNSDLVESSEYIHREL